MKYAFPFFGLIFASSAFAQTVPLEQMQLQRNNFMGAYAQCDTASIELRQQLATIQAQLKALQDKYEPKKDEKK